MELAILAGLVVAGIASGAKESKKDVINRKKYLYGKESLFRTYVPDDINPRMAFEDGNRYQALETAKQFHSAVIRSDFDRMSYGNATEMEIRHRSLHPRQKPYFGTIEI